MSEFNPNYSVPPGEYIKDELEAREWNQSGLARRMGISRSMVSRIVKGNRRITPDMASKLGNAFGVNAMLWINLSDHWAKHVDSNLK